MTAVGAVLVAGSLWKTHTHTIVSVGRNTTEWSNNTSLLQFPDVSDFLFLLMLSFNFVHFLLHFIVGMMSNWESVWIKIHCVRACVTLGVEQG